MKNTQLSRRTFLKFTAIGASVSTAVAVTAQVSFWDRARATVNAWASRRKPVVVASTVIPKRGAVPARIVEAEQLLMPTFEEVSNPIVHLSDIAQRRFYLVDRAQIMAKECMQRRADAEVFEALS